MNDNIKQRERTAWHEAGHSAILVRLFGRLDYVSIRCNDQYWGETRTLPDDWNYVAPTSDEQVAHTAKICTMLLCGAAAVLKLRGEIQQVHVSRDLSDAHDLLQTVIASEYKEMKAFKRIWKHAQNVVEEEWQAICAVAMALLEKETLTGDEVVTFINDMKEY